MGWLLLSISCVRLAPQLISAFSWATVRHKSHARRRDGEGAADHTARKILCPIVAKRYVAMKHLMRRAVTQARRMVSAPRVPRRERWSRTL